MADTKHHDIFAAGRIIRSRTDDLHEINMADAMLDAIGLHLGYEDSRLFNLARAHVREFIEAVKTETKKE